MINLLPAKEKRELLAEKAKRTTIIIWFLFLFFLVCFILILLSIKIYIQGQIDSNKAYLANTEKEFVQSESKEFRSYIDVANSDLKKLDSFYKKRVNFSDVLERISSLVPADIYLTEVSFKQVVEGDKDNKKKKLAVVISGFAPLLDDVTEFENNLKERFEDVNFPLSNWLEEKDINLYVTFKIPL